MSEIYIDRIAVTDGAGGGVSAVPVPGTGLLALPPLALLAWQRKRTRGAGAHA